MEIGNEKQGLSIENLPDPMACCQITKDREGSSVGCTFLVVNPAFEKMIGLTKDKLAGQHIKDILPKIEGPVFDWLALCSEAETAEKAIRFEQIIDPPGEWYEIIAYKEAPDLVAIIFRNISGYKSPGRPQPDSKVPDLEEIIDAGELQSLLEELYRLIKLPVSIIDLKGKVLAGVGWQDICIKFHRVHPETRKNCLESDIRLSSGISPGKYKIYKCNNNMLDIVTPIVVDGSHLGNIFMGQFFFEDEPLDFELFRAQAQKYGFDEEKYISALKQVPCYSREKVQQAMSFFKKLAHHISQQGYTNLIIKHTLKEHGKAELELEKSRSEYKNLVESLNEGIAITDDKENLIYVNPTSEKTFGVEPGGLTGRNLKDFLTYENFQKVMAQTQSRKQGQSGSYELEIVRADKSRGLIKVSAAPRFDGGRYIGSFVVFQDITESKKAEKRLKEEFSLRNALLDNIPNCIALILKKGTREIVASNRAGHEIGAIQGKTCYQTSALREDPCPFCLAPEMWKSGQLQQIEVEYRDTWYEGVWAPLSNDLYVHYIFDITERKRSERLLQARFDLLEFSTKNELDEVLQQTLDEVCALVKSPIGFYHFVSPDEKVVTLKTWSTSTLEHFCKMGSLHEKSYSLAEAGVWAECVQKREPVIHNNYNSLTHRKGLPDGHAEVIRELVVPIMRNEQIVAILGVGNKAQDYDDRDVQIVSYFADLAWTIVEKKVAEEEIRTLNEELEERVRKRTAQLEVANRELDAFTYSASHDLRGPLNRISGFSKALLEDYAKQLDPQGRDYLQRISNSSQHMSELIDDLLKLSRVSQHQISYEPVELSALVNVCFKELQAREPHRQVETVVASGMVAEGDTSLLRIALENLLANAWKYSAGKDPARIEFGSSVQEDNEVFYIRDNGIGFEMQYAKKIFTAFKRLHDAKTYPGTGVGLSIVSRIIQRHGGEIWAEGEEGKGACFFFTLP